MSATLLEDDLTDFQTELYSFAEIQGALYIVNKYFGFRCNFIIK